MADVYRVVFGFQKGKFSPSETYFTTPMEPDALGAHVQKLIDARTKILPSDCQWVGVRIGKAPPAEQQVNNVARRGRLYPPGTYSLQFSGILLKVPSDGSSSTAVVQGLPDQARACLQCKVVYDTDRAVTRYLSLVPDSVLTGQTQSYDIQGNPTWVEAFNAFQEELISGRWQIRARSRASGFQEVPIETWVKSESAPNLIGPVVTSATAPTYKPGEFVQIMSVRRKGTDKLSYNGRYFVESVNANTIPDKTIIFLRGSEMGNPDSIKLPGKVQRIGYTYYPIRFYIPLRAGVHKRGNSFGAVRGRRLTRVSLDP